MCIFEMDSIMAKRMILMKLADMIQGIYHVFSPNKNSKNVTPDRGKWIFNFSIKKSL